MGNKTEVGFSRPKNLPASDIRYWRFFEAALGLGLWEFDLANHNVWRPLCKDRIFGYEIPLPNFTYEMFLGHVVPEDRPEVSREFGEAIAKLTNWDFECRIRRKDGKKRWIWVKGGPVNDRKGPVKMFCVVQDITGRKRDEQELKQNAIKLRNIMDETVKAMALVLELRDPYTAEHERRVAQLICAIAHEMGLSEHKIEGLRVAAFMHDLGKIAVPAEILCKPGKLNKNEFAIIKTHPQCGHDVLKQIQFVWPIAMTTLRHHERLNGSGYPNGISGDQIILEDRILAVADVVEAISSHRPYRPALGIELALAEIAKNSGVLYDPKVVDACIKLFSKKQFHFK